MTGGEIVRIVFAIFGVVCALCGFAFAFTGQHLPEAMRYLPIPLIIVSVAILLILKTTSKYNTVSAKLKRGFEEAERLEKEEMEKLAAANENAVEDENSESGNTQEQTSNASGNSQISDTKNE